MSRETKQRKTSTPVRRAPASPLPPTPRTMPGEPSEVLGRHKNTGQKDHKGAR
jgi:hypothetical protein